MSKVIVIDTETTNSIEQPMPYDFGWAVVDDETGEIFEERSFVCAEIFLDKELMSTAYFASKIPNYWKDIKSGKRVLKGLINIRKILWADMKTYEIEKVGAYNMGFDRRASMNDIRYITGSWLKWFFPYKTEFFCIWHMACTSFLNTREYVTFAKEHGFVSECGNVQTSAECAFRYLTNNADFVESHTGLEDVKIEIAIFMECLKTGTDEMKSTINSGCWQRVQRVRKQMELEEVFS